MTLQSPYYSNLPKGSRPEELGMAGRIRSLIDIKQKAIQQDRNRIGRELAGSGNPDMVRQEFAERESRLMAEIGQLQQQLQAMESSSQGGPMAQAPQFRQDVDAGRGNVSDEAILAGLRDGSITREEALSVLAQRYGQEKAAQMVGGAPSEPGFNQRGDPLSREQIIRGGVPERGTPPGQDFRTQPPAPTPGMPQDLRMDQPVSGQMPASGGLPPGQDFRTQPGAPTPGMPQDFSGFDFNQLPQSLEDLYGAGIARQSELGNFLSQNFGGVSGNFRDFMERNLPGIGFGGIDPYQMALNVADVLSPNPAETFAQFLGGLPQNAGGVANIPGMDAVQQIASMLSAGANAPGLAGTQRGFLNQLSRDPQTQANMALLPQVAGMPSRFRQGFADYAGDIFNQIIATMGTQPDFQFLPEILRRGGF